MRKINSKIVGFTVSKQEAPKAIQSNVVQMHEQVTRPEALEGRTYKLKSPLIEASLYITINDIVLNKGTEHETRRPYEIFINSKDTGSFQWVVALTRLMSAVFRKGGDVTFVVEELASVFDPAGGYPSKDGYVPSLIAEIGKVVKQHFVHIGLLKEPAITLPEGKTLSYDNAGICPKCSQKALARSEGCSTCLSCGYSKCG